MIVSSAIEKMIAFYQGNLHDINHFLKVWAFAKTIGEQEGLDDQTQLTLELAAVVHDMPARCAGRNMAMPMENTRSWKARRW